MFHEQDRSCKGFIWLYYFARLEYDRGVTMPGASSKAANYVGDLNQAAHVSESL